MTSVRQNETDGSDSPSASAFLPFRASRIIFGSCNSQYYEQPFWKIIRARNSTAFIWTGDAVYADDRTRLSGSNEDPTPSTTDKFHKEENSRWWWQSLLKRRSRSRQISYATPEYLREVYKNQLQVKDYRELLEEDNGSGGRISIFGAIDDHDYGINNGDKTFPFRRESGMEFTAFLGLKNESSAMTRRAAKGLGVYGVQVYNFSSSTHRLLTDAEAGLDPDVVSEATYIDRSNDSAEKSNQLVAIFVLDVRSNKTPWAQNFPKRFTLDPEGDFLGEHQWKWFETAIGRSKASVNIIVSGIQVHAPWFYDANKVENWSGFPKAQHRLYQTILRPNVRAPILISGDVHLSQFLRKDCLKMATAADPTRVSYRIIRPLYEVTSSGMTHSWGSNASFCGRPNKSRMCTFYPFKVLVKAVMTYAHFVSPWTALLLNNDDNDSIHSDRSWKKKKQQQYSLDRNVAEFQFDWTERTVIVRILGVEGQTLLRQDWSMNRLDGGIRTTAEADTLLSQKAFDIGQHRLESSLKTTFPRGHNEYICVNYRGNIDRVHFAFSVISTIGVFMIGGMCPILFCFFVLTKVVIRRYQTNKKLLARRRKSTSTTVKRSKKD